MKKVLLPAAFGLFVLSCNKNELPMTQPVTATHVDHSSQRMFKDFNYVLQVDQYGNYSCPTPKVDCTKISPDPTSMATLSGIDAAIAAGPEAVTTFFNSESWEEGCPFMAGEQALLTGLQDGAYTMVRRTNDRNDAFYMVVAGNGADFQKNNVLFTFMLEAQ